MSRPTLPTMFSRPASLPALLLLVAGLVTPADALPAQETTLEVQGSGEVEVAPDRARVSFAVETEAETARDASEQNARLMDEVVSAVRAHDLPGLRVETSGYRLEPRYRFVDEERRREIAGYTARNTVQVIVDDVEAVGSLVDTALEAGANRVAGLAFELQDPEPHRLEALRRAVAQARGEAEVMAEALGMRLGDPVRVQGGAQRPSPGPVMAAFRMEETAADAPTTPVEAGLRTLSASVTVTYRLHPR